MVCILIPKITLYTSNKWYAANRWRVYNSSSGTEFPPASHSPRYPKGFPQSTGTIQDINKILPTFTFPTNIICVCGNSFANHYPASKYHSVLAPKSCLFILKKTKIHTITKKDKLSHFNLSFIIIQWNIFCRCLTYLDVGFGTPCTGDFFNYLAIPPISIFK